MICINSIINPADLASINFLIDDKNNQDGTLTAGSQAKLVKNNIQQFDGDALIFSEKTLRHFFDTSPIIQNYVFPKAYAKMRLVRYFEGMYYGKHVDNVIQNKMRTDMSFTVFLSPPQDYDGGILRIHQQNSFQDIKLPEGAIILYPSDSLHEITPVTRGERRVIVGWIQSYVKDTAIRNILYDLSCAKDALSQAQEQAQNLPQTPCPIQEKIMHSFNRLYRLYCET
jgi:PKHD-type hydroxylase